MNSLIQIKKTIKDYKNLRASRYIPVRGDEIGTRVFELDKYYVCLLYTSPSPRDKRQSRMASSA